jgi:hypothetical protein
MKRLGKAIIFIFVVLALIIIAEITFSLRNNLCCKCRYRVRRNRHGINTDTCKIWNVPCDGVMECKYYDEL